LRFVRGLFVGRFQPFHNGHLAAVRHIERQGHDPIVAIGSAQISHTLENPFTARERWSMIEGTLQAEGIGQGVAIVPVPDINRNTLWVRHVETLLPPFAVVYTNNALPALLFSEAGYKVEPIPFADRAHNEATQIRRLMIEGGPWETFVPKPAARIVHEVHGVDRMRALARDAPVARGAPASSGDDADAPGA
jgi:nicotinamide-nucleotide adenylyltransferase